MRCSPLSLTLVAALPSLPPSRFVRTRAAVDVGEVVERCIAKLLSVKSMRPGTEVALPGDDIAVVVKRAREVFLAQPMLLEVCAPDTSRESEFHVVRHFD